MKEINRVCNINKKNPMKSMMKWKQNNNLGIIRGLDGTLSYFSSALRIPRLSTLENCH